MPDNIYEATNKYILKYDKYDLDIKQAKLLLIESMNEYIHALTEYFKPVFKNGFQVDIRGELIFIQTNGDINKDVLDAVNNLAEDAEVEFEVNIADTEKTILIYINSLYENITSNEIEDVTTDGL